MNTIDVVDYLPTLLAKSNTAIAVYVTLKHFCNKKGQCDIALGDVCTNLNLSPSDMKSACEALVNCGLVIKTPEGFVVNMSPKRLANSSKLSDYAFGDTIPNGYEVLLDDQQMYRCYTTNGVALWKVLAEVARFFNLDYNVLKRLMDNPNFRNKFAAVREKAETAAEVSGARVTKRKLKKSSDKTVSELVEQLMTEVHMKNEHEIPRHEWKAPQLLRQYCLLFAERYNHSYDFTQNPFGSLEMREMKKIHEAFDQDSLEACNFLEWCFKVKSNEATIKFPLGARFVSNDNVIREYKQLGKAIQKHIKTPVIKIERKAILPTDFIQWIVSHYPKLQEVYHFSKMEDLQWIKKACDDNELPHPDLKFVIEHAIEVGLLPKEGEVQFA